jgi:hypothetical protein
VNGDATGFSWETYIFLIIFAGLIIWSILRRRNSGNIKIRATMGLMSEINGNLKVVDERLRNWKIYKKFKTGEWTAYKDRLDFLDPAVRDNINKAFLMAGDFNCRIETARKNKSTVYLADIPVESLREPLTRSKEGIQAWLKANLQTEMYARPRRGMFG